MSEKNPDSIKVSTVYTFAMPKHICVQVRGVEKAVRILADAAEETGTVGASDFTLSLKLNDKPVGKFRGHAVDGWWIEDEGDS